jgi:hypothetical protein
VITPWSSSINPNSFSTEMWVKPAVIPKFAYIAASAQIASPRSGWYLAQDDGSTFSAGSAFVVRLFNQNGTAATVQLAAPLDLPLGSWYHLVLTYDGTTATLYRNGVAITNAPAAYVANVSGPFTVGSRSDNNFYWPGDAAEVAMYGSALSAAQVATHYSAATTTPASYVTTVQADSPLVYYRFREAMNPMAANLGSRGTAADGIYVYNAKPGVTGPVPPPFAGFQSTNKAVAFDGAGSGVVRIPALNINTNTLTITAWVKATNSQPLGAGLVVCRAGTTAAGLIIDGVYGGYGLGYAWADADGAYNWSPSSDSGLPQLPDSEWAFVGLVVQPSQAEIYICDKDNYANFTSVVNAFTHVNQAFDGITLLGSDPYNSNRKFNGAIDEVAIFNRALSSGELYTQYASAVGGVPPKVFTDLIPPTEVIEGNPLVITVDAGGTPPLTYTWSKNGTTVGTTTNGVLTITGATLGDSGSYEVTIANSVGNVSSGPVTVTVSQSTAPEVTETYGFQNRTLYPGGSLTMSVVASGGGLKYQWYKDAIAIDGATSSSLRFSSLATTNGGDYSLTITNTLGSKTVGPVTITIPTLGSYEALVVDSAPEAWWRLGETAGSTELLDSMGRHDGYYTNLDGTLPPVALGAAGAIAGDANSAATFSPTTKGVGVIPFSMDLNTAKFSVEAWVKTTVVDGTLVPISSTFGSAGWWWQTTGGNWAGYGPSGYAPLSDYNPAVAIAAGQWTHLVICYDSSRTISGTKYPWTYYVNGETDGYVWTGSTAVTAGPFIIGGRGVDATTVADRFFDGQVDEVAVYNRVLGDAEVAEHFEGRFGTITQPYFIGSFMPQTVTTGRSLSYSTIVQGSTPITLQWYKDGTAISGATTSSLSLSDVQVSDTGTYVLWATNVAGVSSQSVDVTVIQPVSYANVTNGLVLHLPFDGDSLDTSGRANNGTPVGSPTFVTGIIGSQALQYATVTETNGSTVSFVSADYLDLGRPTDLQFGAASSFSIGLWVKLATNALEGDLPFIGVATNSNNNAGWDLSPSYQKGGWQWCLNDGVNNINVSGPEGSINDGAWHHFVLTVDRASKVADSYLDGMRTATRDISSLGSVDNGGLVTIGQDPTGTYPEAGLAALDDLGVWTRALTALEVTQMHSAGITSGRSFDTVAADVSITVTKNGANLTLSWSRGTLLQSDTIGSGAVWTAVPGASAPSYTVVPDGAMKFYRVQVE